MIWSTENSSGSPYTLTSFIWFNLVQSKLDSTQEALSNEASRQMYQMWKVQENMRSEYNTLEVDCLVKEYICEVNDICENLVSHSD